MDKIDTLRRSENMRRIRSRDTKPEIIVRKIVRDLGYVGYRIHRKDIAGKPDLAWIGRKVAIFVHGCFWHGHNCKEGIRRPKTRAEYWSSKIEGNRRRDLKQTELLASGGWRVMIIWDCELTNRDAVKARLESFLLR